MTKIFIFLLSGLLSLNLFASEATCRLPAGETLTIGCSTDCGWSVKNALRTYASKLGYKLNLVNMAKSKISNDYSQIDGVIIPGGEDIDPIHYKYEVEADLRQTIEDLDHLVDYTREGAKRDKFELNLLANYFANKDYDSLPLLGICRGMQILTVSQKIPLYIDIKAELKIPNRRDLNDEITITSESSLIKQMLGLTTFKAYKNHHQGLRVDYFEKYQATRWPEISITAYSNNRLIAEAMEFRDRPTMGIQFHPEVDRGSLREKIFSWVLERSCENKNKKL